MSHPIWRWWYAMKRSSVIYLQTPGKFYQAIFFHEAFPPLTWERNEIWNVLLSINCNLDSSYIVTKWKLFFYCFSQSNIIHLNVLRIFYSFITMSIEKSTLFDFSLIIFDCSCLLVDSRSTTFLIYYPFRDENKSL